jgi:hypothetical protein
MKKKATTTTTTHLTLLLLTALLLPPTAQDPNCATPDPKSQASCLLCKPPYCRHQTEKKDINLKYNCTACPTEKVPENCKTPGTQYIKTSADGQPAKFEPLVVCDQCKDGYFYDDPIGGAYDQMGRKCPHCNLGGCKNCTKRFFCTECEKEFGMKNYGDDEQYCQRSAGYRLVGTLMISGFCGGLLSIGFFGFCFKYYRLISRKVKLD